MVSVDYKIKLENSDKTMLISLTPKQPTRSIIELCYRIFKLQKPENFDNTRLYQEIENQTIEVIINEQNLRWGDYDFIPEKELIFSP